jgi:hypothetical protein
MIGLKFFSIKIKLYFCKKQVIMDVIRLNTIFPEMITSRESLRLLLPYVENNESIILDFEDIHFISRSVADELFTIQMEKNIRFEFRKLNHNIEAMIQAVSKTQNGSNREMRNIPYTSFSTNEELNKFLEAI